MSDLLIGTDTPLSNAAQFAFNTAKTAVQNILDLYTATGLDQLTNSELTRLFNDTKGLLYDKITGGSTSLTGVDADIELDKAAAYNIISKPVGTAAIFTAISDLRLQTDIGYAGNIRTYLFRYDLANIADYFVIDEDGILQFSASVITRLDAVGKIYIKKNASKAIFAFVQDVAAAFYANGLDSYYKKNYNLDGLFEIINEQLKTGLKLNDQTFEPTLSGLRAIQGLDTQFSS